MTVTQLFRVLIDNVDVNDKIISIEITSELGRGYDVATLKSLVPFSILDSVEIGLGEREFFGFVHRVTQKSDRFYEIECRSKSAKMTSPYSPDEHVLEPAQSAVELISLYRDKHNIDIDYRLCDVDFGASWERDGTALRSLEQIAAIFDAQIVATESGLRIEEFAQSERDVIELDLHHFLEREPTPQLEMRYPISTVIIQTADSDERPAGYHTEISCNAIVTGRCFEGS